ncbi:MAG: homocysteine S-methyltransferase family protein [Deltaproteobacteria bacterium]|nr:homocysteine S-methyltransferase family protein [Deltaproteobacteria bacterium]
MKKKEGILQQFQGRVIILDGATGTELQARGMPEGVCPELWCLDNRECIQSVHEDYIKAGSDIIYTCTFGANRFKLSEYGAANIEEINTRLAGLAKRVAGDKCLVAGDIGPTGRFIEPFGEVDFDEAVEVFKEQARGLLAGGADLIVIETMIDIQEARAALIAVKEITDAFTMVSMTFESSGRTLGGTDPVSALITLQSLGADAVGCNCSTGPDGMIPLISSMQPYAAVPLVAKPNAGLPKLRQGKTFFDMEPNQFSAYSHEFVSSGVHLIGGCCGTTPAHIKTLKKSLAGLTANTPGMIPASALSSARKTIFFQKESPLVIIGERINPTGKKDLQDELLQGKTGLVKRYAREQAQGGADLLDVNVGMPGIDEAETIRAVVKDLAVSTDAPLCIDSSVPEAIEAALRVYPGRALINSISGEENKRDNLLRIARKYGAMFILLPIGGKKLPKTTPERIALIEDIFKAAQGYGFTKEDIIVDALTFAVSADQGAAMETLQTIKWCAHDFGCRTVLGLSNVSFGLPQRVWINAAFMAMAISMGLTHAIANPLSTEFMNIKRASDVLMRRDKEAKGYISHFTGSKEGSGSGPKGLSSEKARQTISAGQRVYNCIVEGNRDEIISLIQEAMKENLTPHTIVNTHMVPAIREVGDLYEKKIYFLPQLISSAETMKKGFEHLEPLIKDDERLSSKKGKILLATVKGDIHDIGKNIIALMLKNQGFEVIDLGKDVPHEDIIDAAMRHKPDIVGLSALMTTTMVNMKEVIDLSHKAGLTCRFMIGGAVVTRSYADSIGAHYAKDGVEAVRLAESLTA